MSQKFFKTRAGVNTPAVTFTNAANANLQVSYLESNTLSFSGTSGQLFSVTDSMSGIIFGVNDVSGVPSIEVLDTGVVRLAETFGNVLIGTSTDNGSKLQVTGNISVTGTVDGRDVSVDGTKLDGIEAGATADMTATEILNAIKTVDGIGSGLDADLLDGLASATAATASTVVVRDASGNFAANMITGSISGNAGTVTNGIYTTNAPLYDRGTLAGTSDWNTFTSAGIYQVAGASIGTNGPGGAYSYGQLVVTTNSNTVTQTYTTHSSPVQVWARIKYNVSDWQPWILKLTNSNFTSYAPSLTGTGATGTWGINVTGQSRSVKTSGYGDTEFTFQQLDTPFAGYTGGWASYLIANHGAGASYYNQTLILPFFEGAPKYSRMVGGVQSNVFSLLSEENFTTYAPSLTGAGASGNWGINVTGSAAKLTTGRTIAITGDVTYNSGAFDGSANVTAAATLASVGTAGTYTKVTTDDKGRVTSGTTLAASDIPSLDASKITSGTIDAARLPSYVDDVIEAANLASFPATGETGKIYVALDTNKPYRWSGSAYIFITSGAVDSVAGKTGVVTLVKADVGLGNVDNTSDAVKNVLSAVNVTGVVAVANGGTGSSTQAGARTNLGLGTMATQTATNYLSKTETYFAGHAPEGISLANAYLLNDFGNARLRGSTFTFTNISPTNAQIDGLFDGRGTYLTLNTLTQTFPVVIEFTLPRALLYGARIGVSFGAVDWRARSVKIETFTEGAWVTRLDTTTNAVADLTATMDGAAIGTTAVRYTFADPATSGSSNFRILHLWGYNYNSDMWSQVIMPRVGGSFYGNVTVPTLTATSGVTNAGTLALSATGANVITASTNGLERIRIDASGNTGIGTSSPVQKLEVRGWGRFGIPGSDAGIEFEGGYGKIYRESSTGNIKIEPQVNTVIVNGNVGVGASNPAAKLHLGGSTNNEVRVDTTASGYLQLGQFTNGGFIGTSSTDATAGILRFGTGGAERLRIDASGNLGVGTTGPSLGGGATRKEIAISGSTDAYVTFNASNGFNGYIGGSGGGVTVASTVASPLVLATNGAERARIHASGGMSLGNTTDPGASNLSVTGNISVTGTVDGRDLSVDGAKLDGIASGATANQGTVTSVSGTGSYGGLSLSGTVTGSGSLTLGGTPTGTWPISISGSAASATTASQIDSIEFRNGNFGNPVGPDTINDNGIGYITGVSLFGQNDGALYSQAYSSSWVHQIYGDYRTGQLAVRGRNNGTLTSWRSVLDSSNYSSYAPTLTGTGASGTWPISVSGSAATATTLQNARNINGVSFNGSSDITVNATTPFSLRVLDSGGGVASGSTFNGSALYSISYNSVGASPLAGSSSLTTTGTITSGTWNGSVVGIAYGGTGASTQAGAANAILPTQTANSGSYLTTDGTNVSWGTISASGGGATGGSTDKVFYENDTIITTSYTIGASKNAMTAGPITINSGVSVTIPSGSVWTVV